MLLSKSLEGRYITADPCNDTYLTFEKIKGFLFTVYVLLPSIELRSSRRRFNSPTPTR